MESAPLAYCGKKKHLAFEILLILTLISSIIVLYILDYITGRDRKRYDERVRLEWRLKKWVERK